MAPAAPASLLNSESYFLIRALLRRYLARLRTKCYRSAACGRVLRAELRRRRHRTPTRGLAPRTGGNGRVADFKLKALGSAWDNSSVVSDNTSNEERDKIERDKIKNVNGARERRSERGPIISEAIPLSG